VPDAVAVPAQVDHRVADGLLLERDLGDGLGRRVGHAVLEEGSRVLVVDEDQSLVGSAQREVREEVVVEPVAKPPAGRVVEVVAPADDDVGAVAVGHLEGVGGRGAEGPEVRERVRPGEGRLGRGGVEHAAGATERGDRGRRCSGGRDAADEVAARRGPRSGCGQRGGFHGAASYAPTRAGPVTGW
jgi:hypothetical protein